MFSVFLLLVLFCRAQTVTIGQSKADHVFVASEENDNKEVLGLATGHGVLAVATPQRIFLYTDDEKRRKAGKITLPFVERKVFHELKTLSQSEVFYCDESSCGLCTYSAEKSSCSSLSLHKLAEVRTITSAAVVKLPHSELLLLRISFIDDINNERAYVLRFKAQDNGLITADTEALDAPFIVDHDTVGGFERNGFVYFIVSAKQPYEPESNIAKIVPNNESIAKIIRICAGDQTDVLASKMSVRLSCDDEQENSRKVPVSAEASSYDPAKDELTIAIKNIATSAHSICKFKMSRVEEKFNRSWDVCQNTTIQQSQECEEIRDESELERNPHCLIFSHMAQGFTLTVCSRYGGSGRVLNNCELGSAIANTYRYGWLEDYSYLRGSQTIRLNPKNQINKLSSLVFDKKALYVSAIKKESKKILRIIDESKSRVVWGTDSSLANRFAMAVVAKSPLKLIFPNNQEVRYKESSCQDLYTTCDQLNEGGWSDPLNCAWCTSNSENYAVPAEPSSKATCSRFIRDVCPPLVHNVAYYSNKTGLNVYGSRLGSMQNSYVSICGEKCIPTTAIASDATTFSCDLQSTIPTDCDQFQLIGQLGGTPSYEIQLSGAPERQESKATQTEDGSKSSSSRTWKAALAVLAVLGLFFVLALIVYFMRNRLPKMKSHLRQTPMIPRRENDYALDSFHPSGRHTPSLNGDGYVSIFRDLPSGLKIDFKHLHINKNENLGEGHYGVVFSAFYTYPKGTNTKVACKFMKEGRVSEFYEEARTMSEFNHRHVLKLVGISLEDNTNCPIAVTRFMANGDLAKYLRNGENEVTLRELLRFSSEIAEGMAHIHEQGYIHRDLAARNCMLDDRMHVQIADFGLCRKLDETTQTYTLIDHNRSIPLKWMPPEILDKKFGYKFDVWSYGVLLWELMKRGAMPFGSIDGKDVPGLLKEGHRLRQPEYCPNNLYEVMLKCWAKDPNDRPTFLELIAIIREVVDELERSQYAHLHSAYERASDAFSRASTSAQQQQQITDF